MTISKKYILSYIPKPKLLTLLIFLTLDVGVLYLEAARHVRRRDRDRGRQVAALAAMCHADGDGIGAVLALAVGVDDWLEGDHRCVEMPF